MTNLLCKPASFDFGAIFSNLVSKWYFYVALAVTIILIVVYSIFFKSKRNNLSNTQRLVYVAVLSALAVLTNFLTISLGASLQLSFVALIGFIAGYLLGGGLGFAVSFIGDFICGIIAPFGAYNPIIGIGTGLWGFIPGFIFDFFEKYNHYKFVKYIKTIISMILCFILNSFLVNTLGLSLMYTMSFESLLILLPYKLIATVINYALCIGLIALFDKILPKNKFNL